MTPPVTDLVLLGGGHAHLSVLKRFGMRPQPGLRITLVSEGSSAPYSGMLPGLIAGHYTPEEMHVDLHALARFAGARFVDATVTGIDLEGRRLRFADRPPLAFDLLSINAGITPALPARLRDGAGLTPVKPIARFYPRWQALLARVQDATRPLRIAVVGGGAGGLELALAVDYRLRQLRDAAGQPRRVQLALYTASERLLPGHAPGAGRALATVLADRGIALHLATRSEEVADGQLISAAGQRFAADETLWVTQAAPAPWLATAGLAVDTDGFVRVNGQLQSVSHPFVFAAGDCASVEGAARPKAGVYAVRQGLPLAENLRRAAAGQPLRAYHAQRDALAILATGPRSAIALRGRWRLHGTWVWHWKDFIDRRFMRRFQQLPLAMPDIPDLTAPNASPALAALGPLAMRCGGCGSKVGAEILRAAIRDLQPQGTRADVLAGLHAADDAAVTLVPLGRAAVHSIDGFRSFGADPYLFGRITAAHALSDLYAMGATPQSALAYVTLPLAAPGLMQRDLSQVLAGAIATLNADGALLVGGHTAEGAELSLALAVNGHVDPAQLARKDSPQAGDVLLLTKPLGTGVVLAAAMRGLASASAIDACLASMLATNAAAARVLTALPVHALTDVTGFGLAGHLAEMLRRGGYRARLDAAALPVLPDALALAASGIRSSLHRQNARLDPAIALDGVASDETLAALLFDPQTSGGLLIALPAAVAPRALAALATAGVQAHRIGTIEAV